MSDGTAGNRISRHDLRTPLTAILGFGQLLEMEDLTQSQRDAVGEILAAGRRLLEMIDNLDLGNGG